ncbi:MAG TPA: Calx-beta domain-containing protein [Pyrinomonadaceae bacterium]|jgi:DNA-binding beta-propeller fold protein YncE
MPRPRPSARAFGLAALALTLLATLAGGLVPVTSSSPVAERGRPRLSSSASAVGAATVAASAETHFIRKLPLLAKDLAVDPLTQAVYASVPADAGAGGNSLVRIDPAAGTVGAPVFVGSSPGELAVTDDGQFAYVVLEGAGAVRRFDLKTQTPGPQYTLGNGFFDGPYFGLSLSLAPGSPDTFAVFRLVRAGGFSGNVAVFDAGVPRANAFGLSENDASVAFGASAARLYSYAALPRRVSKLNVGPAGVTHDASFQITSPANVDSMKFAGGLLYTASGRVIDPEAGTVVGSFPPDGLSGGYTIDAKAGRAYYVATSNQPSTLTVRAFDIKTFQPVGSVDVQGAAGAATALVRWGANGLALSTDGGQLFLIQTTLVPSDVAVPAPTPTPAATPTPTPTPTPQAFVRQLRLTTNDIAYSPASQLLYASTPSFVLPSSGVASGNSVTSIDPAAGAVLQSTFVGSEPGQLERTADGQHLYVALKGASGVRRFDIATHTAGPLLTLVNQFTDAGGADSAVDIAPVPGSPGSLAVSSLGLAVYDGDVRRAKMGAGGADSAIEFGETPARIYGTRSSSNGADLRRYAVDASGVTLEQTYSNLLESGYIVHDRGRVYVGASSSFARVFDAETGALVASLRVGDTSTPNGDRCNRSSVAVDPAAERVYYLCAGFGLSTADQFRIKVFDTRTFVPLGTLSLSGLAGDIGRLVRWGADGLAFRTSGSQLFILRSSLVAPSDPAPTPTPTPAPTPFPEVSPLPTPAPGELRQVTLTTRDLVVDPATQTIFASVPASAGAGGDSVTPIDPVAGTAGAPIGVGGDPNKLAISDDGTALYVGLDGAKAVRRVDTQTRTAGLQFALGNDPNFGWDYSAGDLSVMPGRPDTVAVSRRRPASPSHGGVAIYDNGVQRPVTTPDRVGGDYIEFSSSPSVLYGQDGSSTDYGFRTMVVAPCGVSTAKIFLGPSAGFHDFKIANGVGYGSAGRAFDPTTGVILGTFSNAGSLGVAEPKAGRYYYLSGSVLRVYDLKTYLVVGELLIPGVSPFEGISRLVRWGEHGLAFNTGTKVFLLENAALIGGTAAAQPAPAPTPATPTFSVAGSVFPANEAEGVVVEATGSFNASAAVGAGTNTYALGGIPPCASVTLTPRKANYTFTPASVTFNNPSELKATDFVATPRVVRLAEPVTAAAEGDHRALIQVFRTGDNSTPAAVDYQTEPGTASDRSDFTAASGTLRFAPKEASKTVEVLLNDDGLVEGLETFTVRLSNPDGALLRGFEATTVSIGDNDAAAPASNPLQGAEYFVRQHYHDFLNREPDAAGLAFWSGQIAACASRADAQARAACLEDRRVEISQAFFLSIEFQATGYLVHRFYAASFPAGPARPGGLPRLAEFLRDTQEVGRGVVVGQAGWPEQLESNKRAFALAWVGRPEFAALYPAGMGAGAFVDALFANAGVTPSAAEREAAVAAYGAGDAEGRAAALRSLADSRSVYNRQYNSAFVLMQYFGYLRRNPNDAPEPGLNLDGYNFWLSKLDEFSLPGEDVRDEQTAVRRVRRAEMVRAFLVSVEYQQRFGPTNFDLRL